MDEQSTSPAPGPGQGIDIKTIVWIVYGCLAAGVLSQGVHLFGVLPLIGLIVAVIKRKEAVGTIYASHFEWVIRTFVIGLIACVAVFVLLMIPGIGMLALLALYVWGIWRLVKGALRLLENKPVENEKAYI